MGVSASGDTAESGVPHVQEPTESAPSAYVAGRAKGVQIPPSSLLIFALEPRDSITLLSEPALVDRPVFGRLHRALPRIDRSDQQTPAVLPPAAAI